ncbi:MAG: SLATT domain-containing protein [Pseudomonadota bacterium]
MSGLSDDAEVLLTDWFRRARESQFIHYECGTWFSRLNYWLGIPAIVLSSAVGTAVFASLDTSASGNQRIGVGLISIVAAVLASLQTFLRFSERGERHRATGSGYGAIRRSLEYLKTFPPPAQEGLERAFDQIRKEMDQLAKDAPEVPARIKKKSDRLLRNHAHDRVFHLPGRRAE